MKQDKETTTLDRFRFEFEWIYPTITNNREERSLPNQRTTTNATRYTHRGPILTNRRDRFGECEEYRTTSPDQSKGRVQNPLARTIRMGDPIEVVRRSRKLWSVEDLAVLIGI
ncbi:hypothetical protein PGTUg99_016409 [Puccinia graminis f. sp. tritici]|uniref:Uncharacterized protein n=1 Tax=Puccinia graminis f. sp. tritici TaxID=56615 RepID=A0A5B0SD44_PUCGR|nr:hypothetical protein PGTUg99_016409 [Puccinia graminis f. sp. tritici]